MKGSIFISYRRDDAPGYAGRLYDRLAAQFGHERVFMDVEGIDPGADFVDAIERAVGSCEILIVIIGHDWLAPDRDGKRRLDDPADFVRLETATALKRGIRVVPVLVEGATMPRAEDIPADLAPLLRRQAVELNHRQWEATSGELIGTLERLLDSAASPAQGARPERVEAPPAPSVEKSTRKWPLTAIVAGLAIAVAAVLVYIAQPWTTTTKPTEPSVARDGKSPPAEIAMQGPGAAQADSQAKPPSGKPIPDADVKPPVTKPPVDAEVKPPVTKPPVDADVKPPAAKPPVDADVKPPVTKPPVEGGAKSPVTKPPVDTRIKPPVTKPGLDVDAKPGIAKPASPPIDLQLPTQPSQPDPGELRLPSPPGRSESADTSPKGPSVAAKAPAPAAAALPARFPRVGDTWQYQVRSIWKNVEPRSYAHQVTSVSEREIAETMSVVATADKPSMTKAFGADTRYVEWRGTGVYMVEFNPFLAAFDALQPDTVWKSLATPVYDPFFSNWNSQGRCTGWETVTVPAGTFKALRVEINSNRPATSSMAMRGNEPVRTLHIAWYAPEAKRMVKQVRTTFAATGGKLDEDTYELVRYSLQ